MRSERIIAGVINTHTGDQSPATLVITNPVHADFHPWLDKKRQIVHVSHPYGTMSGHLIRYHRGGFTVRSIQDGQFSYITFSPADVSEIDITADYAPTIILHTKRA